MTITVDGVSVNASSTFTGTAPLTDAELLAMMVVTPTTPLAANPAAGTDFEWAFTSGSSGDSAFDFLAEGETLVIDYVLKATDSSGATSGESPIDTQVVTITINGTNDTPVFLAESSILFIDDDRGLSGDATWLTLLNDLGYDVTYESIPANGNPINPLSDFDAVIWSNGDQAYTNLTSQNVATLVSYLDGGGKVLYAGGHNLYDEPNVGSFAPNYLGVSSYQYNMPHVTNYPNAVGVGGSYTLNSWSGGYYNGTMISAFAASGSNSLMELNGWNATQNDIAAVNNAGTFSAATWGFDINQLGAQYREAFLRDTLEAMGVAVTAPATTLVETDTTLTHTGTLYIVDVDLSDTVTISVDNVTVNAASTFGGTNPLSTADLLAMMAIAPSTPVAANPTNGTDVDWTFTSGAFGDTAFDFLAEGETLVLDYTLKATDSSGATNGEPSTVAAIDNHHRHGYERRHHCGGRIRPCRGRWDDHHWHVQ